MFKVEDSLSLAVNNMSKEELLFTANSNLYIAYQTLKKFEKN